MSLLAQLVREYRGRYPVSNLIVDFREQSADNTQVFSAWLQALDSTVLDDIQLKLEQLLSDIGPDHAGEDLITSVYLLVPDTHADLEAIAPEDIIALLTNWYEANLLEKLVRRGVVSLSDRMVLDPSVPRVPQFHTSVTRALQVLSSTL